MRSDKTGDASYRPDIEGMRGLAIAAVLVFHLFPSAMPGGFAGVDLFFVLSGFLITRLINDRLESGSFSFADFYARRTRRILPAALATVAATLVIGLLVLTPGELASLGQQAAATVGSVSNILFWRQTGYFTRAAEHTPLLNTWSLAVEEQFYLFEPAALFLVARTSWRARAGRLVAFVTAVSWLLAAWMAVSRPGPAFFLLPTRLWELGIGALLSRASTISPARQLFASALGLVMVVASLAFLHGGLPFPGLLATPICVGTGLLLVSPVSPINRRVLTLAPLRFLGRISYSLYLLHWPLLSLTTIAMNGSESWAVRAGIGVLAIGMASLSVRFIEEPFRHERLSGWMTFARYASLASALIVISCWAWLSGGFRWRLEVQDQTLQQLSDLDRLSTSERHSRAVAISQVGAAQRCHQAPWEDVRQLNESCIDGEAPARAILWGDSHAAHYHPAVTAALGPRAAVLHASRSACPPAAEFAAPNSLKNPIEWRAGCRAFNAQVRQRIEQSSSIEYVFIAAIWSSWLPDNEAYVRDIQLLAEWLAARGKQLIILGEVPTHGFVAANCIQRQQLRSAAWLPLGACASPVGLNPMRLATARRLRSVTPNYFDPDPAFCSSESGACVATDDQAPLYLDVNHLLPRASGRLGPLLTAAMGSGDIGGPKQRRLEPLENSP